MVYGIRLVVNGAAIEDEVNDLRVTKSVVAEDSISIGSACASEAVFSLDSPSISLDNEEITIQIEKDEIWTNLGVYKVCSTSIDRDKYTYTCYDAMTYKLQEPFNAPLEIPITDVAMLGLISTQSGLTVDGLSEMVPTNCYSTLQDTTMRQALSYVAGLQGKNAIINANGHIELKWFTETEYTLTDDTIYMDGITISNEEAFYIDTLRNITTDGEILEETDSEEEKSYRRILTENPLIVSDNIRSILDKIKTITPFKPISVRYYGDFDVNVGDIITVITNGVSYAMPVMEISYDIDGGVVCEAVSKAYSKEEAQIEDNSPKVTKEISTANKIARLTVDADKINFLISYNEQTSQFEITPEGASLIGGTLNILGKNTSQHISIDNDSVDIMDGEVCNASFGRETTIGSRAEDKEIGTYSVAIGIESVASGVCSFSESSNIEKYCDVTSDAHIGDTELYVGLYTADIGTRIIHNGIIYTITQFEAMSRVPLRPNGKATLDKPLLDDIQEGTYLYTILDDVKGATGDFSHAEGYNSTASGEASHCEGCRTTSSGKFSHAEGYSTTASGSESHAEGLGSTSSGKNSHAEGRSTASGEASHSEGISTTASGSGSHAEGRQTIASANYQHVQGKYNEEKENMAFIIGNGADDDNRSNAFEVDWDGNVKAYGDVKATDSSGNEKSLLSHTHTKSQITDFAHTHTKAQITDFAHTHTKSQITDFPTNVSAFTNDSSYMKTTDIGTILTATPSSAVSLTSGTGKNITSKALTKGKWMVKGCVRYPNNSSGYRCASLTTTSNNNSVSETYSVVTPTVSGAISLVEVTKIFNITADSTTIYLVGKQNSGTALSCLGYLEAIKVGV